MKSCKSNDTLPYALHLSSLLKKREVCPQGADNDSRWLQAVLMFLWIIEIVGLAMLIQEFTLKMTDVRNLSLAPLYQHFRGILNILP